MPSMPLPVFCDRLSEGLGAALFILEPFLICFLHKPRNWVRIFRLVGSIGSLEAKAIARWELGSH